MRFLCLFLFVAGLALSGPDPCRAGNLKCNRTTEGTEFWFGFMEGRDQNRGHSLQITVTSRKTSTFEIFLGKSTVPYGGRYTVEANGSVRVEIPLSLAEATGSDSVQEKAVHLVAEDSVNVYALNWAYNSSDAAVIYPSRSLGREYFAMCYTPHVHSEPEHGRNSEFLVVASEDSTKVEITPSVVTAGLKPAGVPFSVVLNKGEVYQVQSLNRRNLAGQGDLTGSFIRSGKPVALFSGSLSTTIPLTAPKGGWDHLYEQMPPLDAWGQEYYAVPLQTRMMDYYRIMAAEDSTTVYAGGNAYLLNRGEWREFSWSRPAQIRSEKPILVAQYSQSQSNDGITNADGFMVLLSPVSQAKNDVTFEALSATQSSVNQFHVNIVIPSSETGNILLDGQLVTGFLPFPDDLRFSCKQQKLTAGTHRLVCRNPASGFVAYVYGYGGNEAFGYGVGFNLNLTLELSESLKMWPHLHAGGDSLVICRGESVKLDAGPFFDFYEWNTGYTERAIQARHDSLYAVTARTVDGCVLRDSITISVRDPRTGIGPDIARCPPYSLRLDGGEGFTGYLWNTGERTRTITVDASGGYDVRAYDAYGCEARDTMVFTLFPVPDIELQVSPLVCGSLENHAGVLLTGGGAEPPQPASWRWDSDRPGELAFSDSSATAARFTAEKWGIYRIRYSLTTPDGCTASDSSLTALYPTPSSQIETLDPGECGAYNREVVYRGNATAAARFHWDYGGLAVIDSTSPYRRVVSLGTSQSKPYLSLMVGENGCFSDTTRLFIGANPDFVMDTRDSRGCDSATIAFSGRLGLADPNLDFLWHFGDRSADSTSALQNPLHWYAAPGSYAVSLSVVNRVTGCRIGFTVDNMVRIVRTPLAAIAVDSAACHGDTLTVSYPGYKDSTLCYWDFRGATPVVQEKGFARIFLDDPTATLELRAGESGCVSKPAVAAVRRKPRFGFTADPAEGCQPLSVSFTAQGEDEMLEYLWMVAGVRVPGPNAAPLFETAGLHGVTLMARSGETGCSDTLVREELVRVFPKPTAAFDVDYPVALLGQSNLTFANRSLLAENHHWDFGDGGGSAAASPHHRYRETGLFPVTLVAGSSHGCLDTASRQVEILPFDLYAPNAFRPSSDIPGNRLFQPVLSGADPAAFRLRLYNRWGQPVFESRDPREAWDGNLKNGKAAPPGNYIWSVEYTDVQGFPHTQQGQVLLIR